ncbi:MAG: hypothetical protein KBC06_01680 [Candidatus Pacebacteria bacterium]|nr:hypothetical protein [Candidatus Paceibacterota bacterium]
MSTFDLPPTGSMGDPKQATEKAKSLEEITTDVCKKIEKAAAEALPREKIEEARRRIEVLHRDFLNGRIEEKEYDTEMAQLRQAEYHAGVATFETLTEFSIALSQAGVSAENKNKVLSHENDHASVAAQADLKFHYKLQFFRMPNKGLGLRPSVVAVFPDEMASEKVIELGKRIVSAPEELSNSDRRILGQPEKR